MCYALTLTALLGCSSGLRGPSQSAQAPRPVQAIGAPKDAVWSATLNALADRSAQIKVSDKAAGLVTTEEIVLPAADGKQAGECAKGAMSTAHPQRVQYTILVAGDSTATLRVSSRLTWYNMYGTLIGECASTGYLEGRLEQAIADRARAR